ncbi:MAG: radical SAM protein, partial [Candidatus Aenigmatarchaeota archaeon]
MSENEDVLPPVSGKDLYRRKFDMHVMITKRCNQNCVYCYYPKEPVPDMTLDMAKDIVKECRTLDKEIFYDLSGGEPLLHKDVFEIIELCLPEGKEVLLNTNGTLIDDNAARKFAEYQEKY